MALSPHYALLANAAQQNDGGDQTADGIGDLNDNETP